MIFVTVGTHEQPFDRLIKEVDDLKKNVIFNEEIIMQTGYSTYIPKLCQWKKLYSYQEMIKFVKEARIVITHGGPSSFIMPLQIGKIPIVVPRQAKFHEHVNDHQLEFCNSVAKRLKNIIVVEHIDQLQDVILNYDKKIDGQTSMIENHNLEFNMQLEKIVSEMFEKK